jgi:hypothetical protein
MKNLVILNPHQIHFDESFYRLTARDHAVDQKTLEEYVCISRSIEACPTLLHIKNRFFAVSGIPFLLAALASKPPMTEVICNLTGNFKATDNVLRTITATEAINYDERIRSGIQYLFAKFDNPLTTLQQQSFKNDYDIIFSKADFLESSSWIDDVSFLVQIKTSTHSDIYVDRLLFLITDIKHRELDCKSLNGIKIDSFRH